MNLAGKTVLVTGATGFIGGRLVEVLHKQHGCRVRALVRNFAKASRIARFPIPMIGGDICDSAKMESAVRGCDIVIHAAVGTSEDRILQRKDTIEGTETVLKAAQKEGVQRVVHFSTISIYGLTPDGTLNESSQVGKLADDYSRNKAEAERLALSFHRPTGLSVAVVQPTVVYGPFASSWTAGPISELKTRQVVLPNGGTGICNPVYIDDVVDATILAAETPSAGGQRFLISGPNAVTWKEFYGAYEAMLGASSTISMDERQFRAAKRAKLTFRDIKSDLIELARHPSGARLRRLKMVSFPFRIAGLVVPRNWRWTAPSEKPVYPIPLPPLPVKPISLPDESMFRWQSAKTRVSIEKAQTVLGFQPKFDFQSGMSKTHRWAEWAGLIPNSIRC